MHQRKIINVVAIVQAQYHQTNIIKLFHLVFGCVLQLPHALMSLLLLLALLLDSIPRNVLAISDMFKLLLTLMELFPCLVLAQLNQIL